jgi:hypothetical protein
MDWLIVVHAPVEPLHPCREVGRFVERLAVHSIGRRDPSDGNADQEYHKQRVPRMAHNYSDWADQ